jgi:hypothetical protein
MSCINPNTKEFKEALKKANGNPLLAEMQLRESTGEDVTSSAEFSNKLDTVLIDFIKGLNIEVDENANELLSSIKINNTNGNTLAAFDMLQKYLAISTEKDIATVPDQAANIVYSFLGRKSKLSKDLWFNIKEWHKYEELYAEYSSKMSNKEEIVMDDEREDFSDTNFHSFAHKQVIIDFISQMIVNNFGTDINVTKLDNPDITKEYFEGLGLKDQYEKKWVKRIWNKLYNFIQEKFFGVVKFEDYNEEKLTNTVLDLVDDVFKKDYSKFISTVVEKDGKIFDNKGTELELKEYEKTLDNDPKAREIIESFAKNPYMNFKLSGSQVIRKYGTLFRKVDEDLHDIDGVIPVETFRKEPNHLQFYNWLYMNKDLKQEKFVKKLMPHLNEQIWYKNVLNSYPNFKLLTAFVGKDHKMAESLTVTGVIDGEFNSKGEYIKDTGYIIDFFLRTREGNYPEIFDEYFKDWKQIFEAKIKMGRAKDMADLVYFDPFLKDKFKFTNKGYRYFTFNKSANLESPAESSTFVQPDNNDYLEGDKC